MELLWATGASIEGFGLWLMAVVLMLSSTPLDLLVRPLLPFLVGFYVACTFPWAYKLIVLGLVLFECRKPLTHLLVEVLRAATPYLPDTLSDACDQFQTWQAAVQDHPQMREWMQYMRHQPSIMQHRTVLFLASVPLALTWTTTVRLVSFASIVFFFHVWFLLHGPLETAASHQLEDVLQFALHLRSELSEASHQLAWAAGIAAAVVWGIPVGLLLPVLVLAVIGLAVALGRDEELEQDYTKKLQSMAKWMPNDEVMEDYLAPLLCPYLVMANNFNHLAEKANKKLIAVWIIYGVITGAWLSFLAWMLYLIMPGFIQYPRVLLVGCVFVSYTQRDETLLGRSSAYLAGISAFLTLEMMITGCACGCRVGSIWNLLVVPLRILTHALWLWAAVPLALVVQQVHSWSLPLRKILLKGWLLSRSDAAGALHLQVPESVQELLDEAMQQMQLEENAAKKDLRVIFLNPTSFTTDAIDAGGLTKHFSTLLSKAARLASHTRPWAFMTLWDTEPAQPAYHLNYEARLLHQQNLEYTVEKVEAHYEALGNLLALIFLKQVPFLRLSKALIKFLLRDQASVRKGQAEAPLRVTLDDLEEMKPSLAKQLRNPSNAGIEDLFCQCDLPAQILDEGSISIATGVPQGPWEPSEEHCEQVAVSVLENHHILPFMEAFRQGFQTRLQMDCLSKLFSVAEVQAMLAGSDSINVVDWRSHTLYRNGSSNHPVIKMLWHTLMQCTQEQLQAFLLECTGQPTPPAGGFQSLEPLFNICIFEEAEVPDALREAKLGYHTCSNTLDLVVGTTEDQLRRSIDHLLVGRQD